jgi:hypothetical protein
MGGGAWCASPVPTPRTMRSADNVVDITAILGGFERRVSAPDFRGGEITAIMGGCALDLREASLATEAVINVFAIWGGITIKVPPDWTVILHGTPVMGGFTEKTARPPDNRKRLVVAATPSWAASKSATEARRRCTACLAVVRGAAVPAGLADAGPGGWPRCWRPAARAGAPACCSRCRWRSCTRTPPRSRPTTCAAPTRSARSTRPRSSAVSA